MNKFKIICEEIEPQFYEKLYPIVAQVPYPTHTKHKTHPNPMKLNTINLQFFNCSYVFQLDCNSIFPKTFLFLNIAWSLNVVCNWHVGHQANSSPQ